MTVGIGIIGLAQSGRTTVFNALTGGRSDSKSYYHEGSHLGIARVPEPRLDELARLLNPKKVIAAEVKYLDLSASVKSLAGDSAIPGELLTQLSNTDALINVVRAFTDESIPHPEGSIEARRDIEAMKLELTFSDLAIIERRLSKIDLSLKKADHAESQQLHHEQELLGRLKTSLEKDIPIRQLELTGEEAKIVCCYQFLSAKPLLIIINIDESQLKEVRELEKELAERFQKPGCLLTTLCGKLETELAQLDEETAAGFREEFGLKQGGLDHIIELSYHLIGLISFFTTVSDEVRAWSIPGGTTALKAAGKIHTDMERGFIRAEVIGCDELLRIGSIAEARKHGLLRLEGKNYIVQDGDVITFLFNV